MFDHKEFDKNFKRTESLVHMGIRVSIFAAIGSLVFFGWVVVKLLGHFGVI